MYKPSFQSVKDEHIALLDKIYDKVEIYTKLGVKGKDLDDIEQYLETINKISFFWDTLLQVIWNEQNKPKYDSFVSFAHSVRHSCADLKNKLYKLITRNTSL